jgi:hypothetical protein
VTEKSLQSFFDAVRTNQRANSKIFPDWTSIIERIDRCFVRAGQSLHDPKPLMSGLLLDRCPYAFKTASGMALAGQVVEVFPILRSVLEYAGYCLLLCKTPELQRVFIFRHASDAEMKAQKRAFTIKAVREVVTRHDARLAVLYADLYQRTIDFGAHPNPHAIFSAMAPLDEREGQAGLMTMALYSEPKILVHAFKSTGQVGLAALHVLQYAFRSDFERLGIGREIEEIAKAGML